MPRSVTADTPAALMQRFRAGRIAASMATDAPDLHIPGLGGRLRPFQRAGVAYMVRTRRCLVADEMGLGKTVEALAALAYASAFPALVVVPSMLLLYWQAQIRHWLPDRPMQVLRSGQRKEIGRGLYLVSYATLRNYIKGQPDFFGKTVKLHGLVCDEAHLGAVAMADGYRPTLFDHIDDVKCCLMDRLVLVLDRLALLVLDQGVSPNRYHGHSLYHGNVAPFPLDAVSSRSLFFPKITECPLGPGTIETNVSHIKKPQEIR